MKNTPSLLPQFLALQIWRQSLLSLWSLLFVVSLFSAWGQEAFEAKPYAVQVSATASGSQIVLSWPLATDASGYYIYRKAKGDTIWTYRGTAVSTATGFPDNALPGEAWEYEVTKTTGLSYQGYGYVYAGMQAPLVESRGKVILVVDQTYVHSLIEHLEKLERNLRGDGWTVIRMNVGRGSTLGDQPDDQPTEASAVRALIRAEYLADPTNVKAVFLFGRIPFIRSGHNAPDGHVMRAFAADSFYGDMDGTGLGLWTDVVDYPYVPNSEDPNPPGDGVFDQNTIPSDVELMVGRVDFAEMHNLVVPATSDPSELELLKRYLLKDHAFRHKKGVFSNIQRRGLIASAWGAHIGDSMHEAPAANGYRNFAAFFGDGQIDTKSANNSVTAPNRWITALDTASYLWAYGAGGGDHYKVAQMGTTPLYKPSPPFPPNTIDEYRLETKELYSKDPWGVFTMIFGSHFLEWDYENQVYPANLMRTFIATPQYGLACVWVGRPHQYYHHMGLGETIGYGFRVSQNNDNNLYKHSVPLDNRGVHMALLGDPTLRMHPVTPPSNLTGVMSPSQGTILNWTASPDSPIGYNVYRASTPAGPFTKKNTALVTGTTYQDYDGHSGTHTYMVRAVKVETSSGVYTNSSQGIYFTISSDSANWTTISAMPVPRAYQTATKLQNNKVLVVGGADEVNSYLGTCYLWDPATGAWSSTGSLTTGRRAHTATLLPNGKVLVVGGVGASGYLGSAELYNPTTGLWSSGGSITARAGHTATLLNNNKVLVVGGAGPGALATARLYDYTLNSWATTGSLTTGGRSGHTATLLSDGKVLVVAGFNSGDLASTELYNPTAGTWSSAGSLATARGGHSATLLTDNSVIVVGGSNFGDELSTVESYSGGTWTTLPNTLNMPRGGHEAIRLGDGRVLIVGGYNGASFLSGTEIFNPTGGTWTPGTAMSWARHDYSATLLTTGTILAVGGYNSYDGYLTRAEIYIP